MSSPAHGKIVDFKEAKKGRAKPGDFHVVVGLPGFEASVLHAFSLAVDRAYCIKCTNKDCEERDGSCWEYEEA